MIYIPSLNANNCVSIDNINSGYIRVYSTTPSPNSSIPYTDYFVNYDYISRSNTQNFSSYVNVNCISHSQITTDYWYRTDLDSILIIFAILFFFIIALPYKIWKRAFGRWLNI